MKLHVITDEKGEVIATTRAGVDENGFEVKIEPVVKGHHLHENVDVPDQLVNTKADELHKMVKQHLLKQ